MDVVGSSDNGRRDKGYTCEVGQGKEAQGRGLRRRQGSDDKGGSRGGGEGIE